MKKPKFEIFKDHNNQYRFRLKSANGKIIAVSESYITKKGVENGIDAVMNAILSIDDYARSEAIKYV